MKKIIVIVTALAILLGASALSVSAALTMDDIMFELNTLGIMEGNEDGDFELDKPITRAEFAAVTVRMLNMDSAAQSYAGEQIYSDVPKDHWANGYICLLSSMGIISGNDDGTFEPDNYLNYNNISKMLVCSLGYSIDAENKGGYPGGYNAVATSLGLLDGVTITEPFTRASTARMVYNALYVKIMTTEYSGDKVGYVISDTTLRDKFTTISDGYVEKREGVVTATVDAYMHTATDNMDVSQIEIDDFMYFTDTTDNVEYIGKSVIYYVNTEENNRIISMTPSQDNEVISFAGDDIASAEDTSITYYDENNAKKIKKIDENVVVLKNNRPMASYNPSDFANLESGEITLINNNSDEDSTIDVILYKTCTSAVVDDVIADRNMIYFIDATPVNGKQYLDIDADRNSSKRIVLYSADGKTLTAGDIEAENVISVYMSDDGTFIEGIVSTEYVDGTVTATDDESITIAGERYMTENDEVAADAVFNREMRAYLNHLNEVVYVKTISSASNYAYAASIYAEDDGDYGLKLIIPDKLQEKTEEEENEDGGDATVVYSIIAKNEELRNVGLASSVTISNEGEASSKYSGSFAAEKLMGKVIRYDLDSEGCIINAQILQPDREGDKKVYNSSERTFSKGNSDSAQGGFGVDFETNTICVPESDNPSKKDYEAVVEMNNGKTYNVKCYDINEDRHMADLIVVTAAMTYGTVGDLTTSSDIGFVTDVVNVMDEDENEETVKITMLADGKEKDYYASEAFKDYENYVVPTRGCMVAYLLNNDGEIENMQIIKNYSGKIKVGLDTSDSSNPLFIGYALSADYHFVSSQYNRWVTRLECGYDLDESSLVYEVYKNNAPPVFIYDKAEGTAEYGDIRSIAVGSDLISIFSSSGKVRAVVAIR